MALWEQWRDLAEREPDRDAVIHLSMGKPAHRWTREQLLRRAEWHAHRLVAAGILPGQVCALMLRHHPEFYPLYLGICAAGAIPAVLGYPNPRLHPDKFRSGLDGMIARSGFDWLLTETSLLEKLGAWSERERLLFPLEDLALAIDGKSQLWQAVEPNTPLLLQHSSGTTGLQKAVVLSHRAVRTHLERYARAVKLSPSDVIVSWLPLYHDMGLIAGFHLPLATGVPLVQLDPMEWVTAPELFLGALSKHGGTVAWLPNFAYHFTADRVHDEDIAELSLERVRLLVNCSEPIRAEGHRKFIERFRRYGLRESALAGCYAMAEATFAVTQTPVGTRARELPADRDALRTGTFREAATEPSTRWCVSSGRPIEGCLVRVVDESRTEVRDGVVGELEVKSESLFDGYRNRAEETAAALAGGWYRTGDLGFRYEGEIYVAGRKKDIIIVAGKNLQPEDIEDEVGSVPRILPGRVVAFAVEDERTGTEAVAVVAETEVNDEKERQQLRLAVRAAVNRVDVTLTRVILVPPRWLVKSSSGKPSRKTNKERALELAAKEES